MENSSENLSEILDAAEAAYNSGDIELADSLSDRAEALSDEIFAKVGLAGTKVSLGPVEYVFV